jgi:hypothetical protein
MEMNGFTNENIIKLVFTNYTLKENKSHLDNINSIKLFPPILRILSFEYIFTSKRTYRTITKPDNGTSELISIPDNNIIEISYNSMKLWDMHSYECKWKLNNGAISITRLPNGHLVTFARSGEIQFWNNNFELIKVIALEACEGHRKRIFSLSNGNLACFAFKDDRDRIIIVDCQANTVVKTLDLQLGIIYSIVSLSDNRFTACSDNGSINIWGMNDYKFLDCFHW